MTQISAVRRPQRRRATRYAKSVKPPGRVRRPSPDPAAVALPRPAISGAAAGQAQTKLKVGEPNDRFEQEADRVADQVMRMPDSAVADSATPTSRATTTMRRLCTECAEEEEQVQRKCAACKTEEQLQARAFDHAEPSAAVSPRLPTRIAALRGGGQPLSANLRTFFEPRFGHDFSKVRVHTDPRAAGTAKAVSARAYAIGPDIVFGTGEYAPATASGRHLLAHELTHVVQQGTGDRRSPQGLRTPIVRHQSSQTAQRRVSFDVISWEATKDRTPIPENNADDPLSIDIPPTPPQFGLSAFVQVNGEADDPCAQYELGTVQSAWIAWIKMKYRGRNRKDGSITLRYVPDLPMRDQNEKDPWFDPTRVKSPGSCGDELSILQKDSPFHLGIPKVLKNTVVSGEPENFLRQYTRGLHLVTYLAAKGPDGFLRKPLRFLYWNSLQDFSFTPDYTDPENEWSFKGKGVRVNIGSKGRGITSDAPFFTTTGESINEHTADDSNWKRRDKS